jgi:hypothetical protein
VTSPPRSRKRWIFLAVKLAVVALVIWGVRRTLLGELAKLNQPIWHFEPFWLAAAGILYLAGIAPSGIFWHQLLWAMDQRPRLAQSLRAYFIGHLGKYVPGKAVVIILRAGLLRREQVDPVAATVTVFYETLSTMAVGAFMAAGIVAVLFHEHWTWMLVAVGLMVVSGLPTVPPLSWRLAKRLGVGRANPNITLHLADLPGRTIALGWLLLALGWTLQGLSLWAVLRAMGIQGEAQLAELPRYTASIALSTVVGFVSFVPGGLVVREAVLTELLAKGTTASATVSPLVAAVLVRIVGLAAELVISAILYLLPAGNRSEPAGPLETRL